MSLRTTLAKTASALLTGAIIAFASPVRAQVADQVGPQIEPCDTAAARDVMAQTLPRAGEERPVNITFNPRAEGAQVPAYLLAQYPEEMTIILQFQFRRLVVRDDRFEVGLWFNGQPERIVIPFNAVEAFYDRSVAKCFGGRNGKGR